MDRFSELHAFVAVIEAEGFSAAARALGQSRSSINRLVIRLEERLGVQLLHRTTRSVAPNSTGRALYERARQLLDDLEEIEHSVQAARSEPEGRLKVSAPTSFGELNFSAVTAAFLKRHPKVEIDISFENRLVDPIAEGFDVVIRVAEPDEATNLVDHRIMTLSYLACAAPAYLEARGTPGDAAALGEHAILYLRQDAGPAIWAIEGPAGPVAVPVRPVLTSNNLEPLLTAALEGLGIALLPEYAVRHALEHRRLVAVLPDHRFPPRMLQVIYPPARHLSARVRLFVEFVEQWCMAP
ncbi:MAG: LysR family transcriptional regulator [Pseudomonadota bacterium]